MSALSELYEEIALCRQCEIAKCRTKVVPGEGAEDADILFIGEAPGWHEDQQGRPFVGPAGLYLDELLASINLKREQVYIANVIKCRPTGKNSILNFPRVTCPPGGTTLSLAPDNAFLSLSLTEISPLVSFVE